MACTTFHTSSPVVPSSYRESFETLPRTVGKLRRLVLVPLIEPAPAICPVKNPQAFTERAALMVKNSQAYLVEHKGYEILPWEDRVRPEGSMIEREELPRAREIVEWGIQAKVDESPPATLKQQIEHLSALYGADGVLVLHLRQTCIAANPGQRRLFAVLTLGMSEILERDALAVLQEQAMAAVIERHSGRKVWHNDLEWAKAMQGLKHGRLSEIELLFKPLETAVPKVLTR